VDEVEEVDPEPQPPKLASRIRKPRNTAVLVVLRLVICDPLVRIPEFFWLESGEQQVYLEKQMKERISIELEPPCPSALP